ncbi:dipeptide/oligopeptide/nickel ABC transporter permease/ATP-binding protein [Skermanella sp. TT6]|uniref:Dipeptide/oligopeptide/nickel ABC transporter permease/ATP-binding protein n=1 Tax=Skermanella cutis TaxID=2775420 RepID=A0ABX7BCR1_9PROT|nr:dipeptide/oligopeptide/nickel ABC transporter permease/ATP-binding protein [Skermanella sp. TT6]QQP92182.1 dipeptide/oligopeptide/nickel ABC transporter permease/ATP-binding protein [Skermanella sp. TT6]
MTAAEAPAVAETAPRPSQRPGWWARLRRNHLAVLGLAILAAIVLTAVAAPILPLPDPNATDLPARLAAPFTPGHLLGADQLGRDMLSRIVWGTRVSLAVGAAAALAAALVGSLIGIVAGFYGRWVDTVLMRAIDMLMAFPYLLLALAIVAALGPGLLNALFAISIVNVPFFARSVRGVTLGLVRRDYVDAARLGGQGDLSILTGEILPNLLPVIVITLSTTLGWMILETAGLSFLGLGAQPPQADLGSMLGEARSLVLVAPHVALIPGLVILLLVIGINLVGDGIRDLLDPRLRSGGLVRPGAATEVAPDAGSLAGDPPDPAALLSVRNLSTHFLLGGERYKAADDVSFDLAPGECLGIVGESGSGKSVTALSILGLVPTPPGRIVKGHIRYRGRDLLCLPLSELQELRGNRIACIFQDPLGTLNPLMTVGEQIAETIRRHQGKGRADAMARAIELMDRVRIPDAAGRAASYPHELSGGQRQRIGIAMALANDPDIIIADEPTTALDVTIQAEVLDLLRDLRRERDTALLFITHDFGVVSDLCDRVMVMYAGRVVETGPVAEVLRDPRHPYTRRLLSCVPVLGRPERALDAIPGLPPAVNRLPRGCHFADRCDRVIDRCRAADVELDPLAPGRASRCIRAREA